MMERRLHRLRSTQTRSAWASSCGPWIVNCGWPRVGPLQLLRAAQRTSNGKQVDWPES
jgi:hypothetical protein